MRRRLSLKRETLTALDPAELTFGGGQALPTTPLADCLRNLSDAANRACDSIVRPCISGPTTCTTL